jgi:hypothetical protein
MADIAGLFQTPEQYQLAQRQAQDAQAIQYANLDPRAKADYGFYSAGQQLAGAIGGALGGQDPQLQKITQRQQLLGMIDPNNPDTYPQAIEAALRGGDQEAAFLLRNEMMKVKQQAQETQLQGYKLTDYLTERGINMQNRGMAADALELSKALIKADGTVDDAVYNQLLGYGKIGSDIIEQRIKGTQGLESQQAQNLAKGLINPDGTRNPEVEKLLSTTLAGREILNKFAPTTKEIKKGEKLAERQPNGTWKIVPLEGLPTQTTTSDNAIQSLIAGQAIHPTVLPYAQQLARSFPNLDPEDQDKAVEKLTTINNTALNRESDKSARAMVQASSLATQALTRQMIELNINKAKDAASKAADGKEIKLADSTKLADKAASVEKLYDLSTSFKPSFAGYPTDAVGNLAVLYAGKLSDPDSVDLFQWWQTYQDYVNKVRNDLFGAALTAPEKAEFDKAMVTKGMDPTQAKANLARQAELAARAYNKLDNVLRVQGYSKAGLDALKPSASLPPLESFLIQSPNSNPSNTTGGRR